VAETNEQLMRRFLGYWATRDADAMVACFAEDGVYDNVPACKPMVGRKAIGEWLDMCFQHLSRIEVAIPVIVSNGEWVLSERLDVHIAGERQMPLPVMNASRIVGGQIVMFRDYYDMQTVTNLGMG